MTCPADVVLECPADISTNKNGVATALDACGAVTITYSDSVSNSCGGTKIISRTLDGHRRLRQQHQRGADAHGA